MGWNWFASVGGVGREWGSLGCEDVVGDAVLEKDVALVATDAVRTKGDDVVVVMLGMEYKSQESASKLSSVSGYIPMSSSGLFVTYLSLHHSSL